MTQFSGAGFGQQQQQRQQQQQQQASSSGASSGGKGAVEAMEKMLKVSSQYAAAEHL
jgi:hypothetical protein